ncbi:MAG TPA: nickel pincer cofactor biosynthesis protein LarB [Myxococcota bacterium]|nr:nickel pincer cofactor biosynthesis protein LarB [Myxococcota bacterium]HRY95633.1 nickel pincer cofactor biosynthesis protein LarB [Myxococcota bacterium]HSA20342.1 nickel pincer cofactor biosynthesis protein LarB [Myxococcota bacterium]
MQTDQLRALLADVAAGRRTPEQALASLRGQPFEELGFATVDLHRGLRTGFPEVIYGQGKTPEQALAIAERLVAAGGPLLVTRVSPEMGAALAARFPDGVHDPHARCFHWQREEPADVGRGVIRVISAGTSDLPVAEEAALTARLMGHRVERVHDVGVAGLHRLLHHRQALETASVLVVVAGMEGALPSVVGGLVACPVIAVPTSAGYGASFEGLAALLGMLSSCAPGVVVVNIDNGFGAGYAAARMNRRTP